jgi:hypothetical protein
MTNTHTFRFSTTTVLATLAITALLGALSTAFAQSDAAIVKEFTTKLAATQRAIDYAADSADIVEAEANVAELEQMGERHRELLNEALYPDNYEVETAKLEKQLENAKLRVSNSLRAISLEEENRRLLEQVIELAQSNEDKDVVIDSLKILSGLLRENIRKRDLLILKMAENIFQAPEFQADSLTEDERKELLVRMRGAQLIENIRKSIKSNIRFARESSLKPDELEDLKRNQLEFAKSWENHGPLMTEIYVTSGKSEEELREINDGIKKWAELVDARIWTGVTKALDTTDLELLHFADGESFTAAIVAYVDPEIDSAAAPGQYDEYVYFADTVWTPIVVEEWAPLLLEFRLIDEEQMNRMENRVADWKAAVGEPEPPASVPVWYYLVAAGVLVAVVAIILFLRARSRKRREDEYDDEDEYASEDADDALADAPQADSDSADATDEDRTKFTRGIDEKSDEDDK